MCGTKTENPATGRLVQARRMRTVRTPLAHRIAFSSHRGSVAFVQRVGRAASTVVRSFGRADGRRFGLRTSFTRYIRR